MLKVKSIEQLNYKYLQYKGKKETLLENIKEIDLLPIQGYKIHFSDEVWKLSKKLDSVNKQNLTLDFTEINYCYKDIIKGVVFQYLALYDLSYTTIRNKLNILKRIYDFLIKNHIFSYELIDVKVAEDYCSQLIGREHLKDHKRKIFKQLLMFIEENYEDIKYKDVINYLLKQRDQMKLKAEKELGKTQDIPEHIFNQMVSCAIKDIKSSSTSYDEKFEASIILILSQTGIRIGELNNIKANKGIKMKIFDNKSVYYLKYFSNKAANKNTKTFLNDKAKLAYDCMSDLSKKYRKKHKTEYIYINRTTGKIYSTNVLRKKIFRFVARNHKYIDCIDKKRDKVKGFTIVQIKDTFNDKGGFFLPKLLREEFINNKTIAYPNPHQFRVAVCSRLIERGIHIDWVREHMNHLEREMTVHYIRRQNKSKKEKEFAKSILRSVVKDDIRLIGKDSDKLMIKIDEFIKENKFNVKEDLESIIEELSRKVPIRQKSNGYCIKSAFGRKCSHDIGGSDIFCAFGICPNHFFTYKTIDITYNQFKNTIKLIEYNIKNLYIAQANLELNKLQRLIDEVLIPQLKEIDYELNRKAQEDFIKENEILKECIVNRTNLMYEVMKWKDMNMKKLMNNLKN